MMAIFLPPFNQMVFREWGEIDLPTRMQETGTKKPQFQMLEMGFGKISSMNASLSSYNPLTE
jgi:hypothetical protein